MPENTFFRLPAYFALSFSVLAALKICLVFYTLWVIVPEKYMILLNLVYLPIRYWAVTVPVLASSAVFFYFVYPTTDAEDIFVNLDLMSADSTNNHAYNSQLLMIPNQNNDCICVNKNLCYKEYYDDVYIECVSKSLHH